VAVKTPVIVVICLQHIDGNPIQRRRERPQRALMARTLAAGGFRDIHIVGRETAA
jgi:hypothetical protein